MRQELLVERFFDALVNGDRPSAREIVRDAAGAAPSEQIITGLFWPAYELIERLYRSDQLSKLSHHLATRLLRVLVDQNAARMAFQTPVNRSILAFCGPRDSDELGAQMAVDLLEQRGFRVSFAGGGIPNDEVLSRVHESKPNILLMFASGANDLPQIRQLIDTLHEIGACPNLQIVVGGGVFNRAEGLAEEIGADLWANDPFELVEAMQSQGTRRAEDEQRTVGRKRRVKREAA
ncbi:MAG: B12-binding domain-containing protein [Phycisphaerales bacterium]